MVNTSINLLEGSFPILVNREDLITEDLTMLGELRNKVKVDIKINKISANLFLAEGIIGASFKVTCQRCNQFTFIDLKINLEVAIKDNSEKELDIKGPYEVHYQNLQLFDIDKLVLEEIYLNFPSTVVCCSSKSDKNTDLNYEQKIQPFKKIKDLIQ